jgi:LuxR family maltose regulon positive regulatory protein
MSTPILATKLYIPPPRPKAVLRPRLVERLNEGLHRKLTLISAPAGFGKTTLVSEWIHDFGFPAAPVRNPKSKIQNSKFCWLSLDEGENDPARFLAYLVAALQTIAPKIGEGLLRALASPQPPPTESMLTALLNEITTLPDPSVLVLDDYHVVDAKAVDQALAFLLEHLPPQMHLVITTREDPHLPLARLRARGQMTELRAAELRFTPAEAAGFLNQVMSLNLSAGDVAALEARTEGWIAGLQLAALSLQGQQDATRFIQSFTGSHHFVMDYLVEEVLHQQSASVQTFLLRTSILDRLCGPLCDAVLLGAPAAGQATLESLEHANLFLVPLDNERRWYRYHHLFADLLRQRLHQHAASSPGQGSERVAEYHIRASQWFEDNGLELEAFQHAATANDVARAERLIEGKGAPLPFRGAGAPVLNWLASLPRTVLDARPSLWMTYASALLTTGHHTAVEQKLQAAEAALQGAAPRGAPRGCPPQGADDRTQDLVGRIASMRATLAVMRHDGETILAQSRRALAYLHPNNLPLRTATTWTLGYAYQLQGDRAAASRAYAEVIAISQSFGASIYTTAATVCLGQVQETDNRLALAAETYRQALLLAGDPPRPIACEAHLGLARIYYQWDDLDAAEQHGQQCVLLTRQTESIETFAGGGVFLARLKLARDDVLGAVAGLDEAEAFVRQHNFMFRMPDVAAAQVLTLLRQGKLAEAAHLAETQDLPFSLARVHLAQGDPATALALLEPLRQQAEAKGWQDERLKVMVFQAVARHAQGEQAQAMQLLGDALALAEPDGFIRIFVDEGLPMRLLILEFGVWIARQSSDPHQERLLAYANKLLAAYGPLQQASDSTSNPVHIQIQNPKSKIQNLVEPLSARELEVLQLIAQGFSNHEISARLFLALSTVKGHNQNIFAKLQVQRRTEAIARARELGLL